MKHFIYKTLIAVLMLTAGFCQLSATTADKESSAIVEIKDEAQFKKAIQADGLTLVDLYAVWCGPCRAMHPILEQLQKDEAEKLKVVRVDVDKNNSIAATYQVRSIPTLLLFKNGKLVWKQVGAMPLEQLKKEVGKFL